VNIEINGEFVDLDEFLETLLKENDEIEANTSWETEIINIADMSFIKN